MRASCQSRFLRGLQVVRDGRIKLYDTLTHTENILATDCDRYGLSLYGRGLSEPFSCDGLQKTGIQIQVRKGGACGSG